MSVPDYKQYSMKDHAQQRVLTRFNIIGSELNKWMQRLLSQATFVRKDKDFKNRSVYRFNDIVIIVDTKQKEVVTIWSQDRDDSHAVSSDVKVVPEVKEAVNEAMKKLIVNKKKQLASRIYGSSNLLSETVSKMTNPYTNDRYVEKNWDELAKNYKAIRDEYDKALVAINDAQRLIDNK